MNMFVIPFLQIARVSFEDRGFVENIMFKATDWNWEALRLGNHERESEIL